jgi:hypothetical protein
LPNKPDTQRHQRQLIPKLRSILTDLQRIPLDDADALRPLFAALTEHLSDVQPLVVRPRTARRMMGNSSEEKLYENINSGELESYLDGGARYITVESIKRLIARRLEEPTTKKDTPRRPASLAT